MMLPLHYRGEGGVKLGGLRTRKRVSVNNAMVMAATACATSKVEVERRAGEGGVQGQVVRAAHEGEVCDREDGCVTGSAKVIA